MPIESGYGGELSWFNIEGHPTIVLWEISVRSPLECLKFSRAQEQLKISKMFRGVCLLGSEFRSGFVWFAHLRISDFVVISRCCEVPLTRKPFDSF